MVRCVAIVLILAHVFLLMFPVQASITGLSDIVRLEQKADFLIQRSIKAEAEQPGTDKDQPHLTAEGEEEGGFDAEAPAASRRLGKHKGTDPSVAGGGVILGGLALAVFAAVFSYIRVTRKRTNVNV